MVLAVIVVFQMDTISSRIIIFIYFLNWKTDLQREVYTRRKIFRLLVYSPSGHSSDPKPGARSFFWIFHAGAGSQAFGPSSTAFPGHQQVSGWEMGHPGYAPVSAYIESWWMQDEDSATRLTCQVQYFFISVKIKDILSSFLHVAHLGEFRDLVLDLFCFLELD